MEGFCEDCGIVTDKLRVEEIRKFQTPLPHWQRRCSHCKRIAIGLKSEYLEADRLTINEKRAILEK